MIHGARHYRPAAMIEFRGVSLPARFGDVSTEFIAARESAALFDRGHRGLAVVRGADRKTWLHNLTTNAVKTLDDNSGNYAFATDVKGRTQFDLNILALPDQLWLDIDARTVTRALAHLDRYLITEKVELRDASADVCRLACSGPGSARVAAGLGVTNLAPMAALSSAQICDDGTRLVRHDFAGSIAFELVVPTAQVATWWDRLVEEFGVVPAGVLTQEALRVEAGIPEWPVDIDDKVIPPETGQIERGISYHKGCYLGQEVIERLRSLGAPARKLVRIASGHAENVALPAALLREGAEVGRLTSLVRHPVRGDWIGLGYVKTVLPTPVELTCGEVGAAVVAR